ncbi:MAG TPA: CoA transferase [Advenella sp.]|nr:CoA transferase [Advenella sp.]
MTDTSRSPDAPRSNRLLCALLPVLQLPPHYAREHLRLGAGNFLPSNLHVNELACGAVAAAALSAADLRQAQTVTVDPAQVSVAFRNDQLQTIDGERAAVFKSHSGFFQTRDGWVRLHGNYPHHRQRLLDALELPDACTREQLADTLRQWRAIDVEETVTAAKGIAVMVRNADQWQQSAQAQQAAGVPLLSIDNITPQTPIPLGAPQGRPRVLDLTRVIAGPVATRTLAYLGCDVLRIDNPAMPELPVQHVDTGADKRSALLDLREPEALHKLHELLSTADVLVTGYRPQALAAFGLDSATLARTYPQLIHATLSAWTFAGPWGERRGFDSIVQAATGIGMLESGDGTTPGALPAQALDHATGYLLAAGILRALKWRSERGGTWRVQAHLLATANWLLASGAATDKGVKLDDVSPWQFSQPSPSGIVIQSRPAFAIDSHAHFSQVGGLWGSDDPSWRTD